MDIISTRAVAEVLGVSEATVKRWSDAGTLRCFRTPGGHRKFRLRDVKAFLSDHGDTVAAEARPLTPVAPLDADQAEVRALALTADVDGLVSFVARHREAGLTMARIFDRMVSPALADIGAAWAEGHLTAAQEHLASSAILDMIGRVRALAAPGRAASFAPRGRAIAACFGGEEHAIGLHMVAVVLASLGYRVGMLGANVPTSDLALMIASEAPALVALSASAHANPERLRGDLAVIASAASVTKTRVIVGGAGFTRLLETKGPLPGSVERLESLEALFAQEAP